MSGVSNLQKNLLCGALTGGIFKSLKGPVGFAVGSLLGATIMFTLTKLTEYGNQKGYVSFEIKY
jgi:import inner membrane translocase subunit TIM23